MARSKGGKPGNPAWVKGGPSPNPGGRPAGPVRFRELYDANDDDDKNYQRLVYWRDSDNAKASIQAIALLLDRRYGKVPNVDDNDDLKRTEIELRVEKLTAEIAALKGGNADGVTADDAQVAQLMREKFGGEGQTYDEGEPANVKEPDPIPR